MAPKLEERAARFFGPAPEQERGSGTLLWSGSTAARWAIVAAAATITWVVCWYVISGQQTWNDQVPTMDVGIFAAIVAAAAHISFLQAGRRAVGLRRRALLGEPAAESESEVYPGADATPLIAPSSDLVAAPGLKHFHLASCPLAAGRGWPIESRGDHLAAGRTPCGVCRP